MRKIYFFTFFRKNISVVSLALMLTGSAKLNASFAPRYMPINEQSKKHTKVQLTELSKAKNWQKFSNRDLKKFKTSTKSRLVLSNKYIFNDNIDSILWKCKVNDSLTIPMNLGKIRMLQFFLALLVDGGEVRKFRIEFLNDKKNTLLSYQFTSSRRYWNHTQFRADFRYKTLTHTYNLWNKSRNELINGTTHLRITALNGSKDVYIGCISYIKNPKLGGGKKSKDFRMDTASDGSDKKLRIKMPKSTLLPAPNTKDLADIAKVEQRLDLLLNANISVSEATGLDAKKFKSISERYKKLKITRTPWAMNGINVTIIPNYSSWQSPENDFAILLHDIANAYWLSNDIKQRNKLENMFIMMFDYHWYIGGMPDSWSGSGDRYVSSLFSMRKVLYNHKRLTNAVVKNMASRLSFNRMYLNYSYYLSGRKGYERNHRGEDIDYMRMRLLDYPMYTLLFPSKREKVFHLKKFTRWLNNIVFRYSPGAADGFKPDGAGYHHLGFLDHYAKSAIEISAKIVWILSQTEFAINPYSHNLIRSVVFKHDFYNKLTMHPPTLSGKGFDPKRYGGSGTNLGDKLAYMALAGTIDRKSKIDREALRLYLLQCERLTKKANKTLVKNKNIYNLAIKEAEKNNVQAATSEQQGHLAMNWGAAAIQRHQNWLGVLKLHSKFQYEAESFNYSTYLGYGTLLFFRDTLLRSGAIKLKYDIGEPGWDWRFMPGTTTVAWDHWEKVKKKDYKRYRAPHTYAGGVELGSFGVSAIDIHGSKAQGLASFRAKKSYFFLNDKVVCLGIDIKNKLKDGETVTTIFQDYLHGSDAIYLNNNKISTKTNSGANLVPEIKNAAVSIFDSEHGYYIFDKQRLYFKRGHQKSPNANGKKESTGNYATAYFNHGTAPNKARYSYIILPYSTPEKTAEFAKKMSAKNASVKIITNSSSVQAVYDSRNKALAISAWRDLPKINLGNVIAISSKCTLIIKKNSEKNQLDVAIAYPDLQLKKPYSLGR
ncbi:chondroitinase family polysaccharide lyase [Lentisphaerota bacterium WC36G]|nr:polysaccharide lyase beta-sandwich domain-containing protein [Lentisphaerae bacterium WC36]